MNSSSHLDKSIQYLTTFSQSWWQILDYSDSTSNDTRNVFPNALFYATDVDNQSYPSGS